MKAGPQNEGAAFTIVTARRWRSPPSPRRGRGAKGPEGAPETAGPAALGEEVAGEPEAEGAVKPPSQREGVEAWGSTVFVGCFSFSLSGGYRERRKGSAGLARM